MTVFKLQSTDWYILKRYDELKIKGVTPGNNPLYGDGSWDLVGGPYGSYTSVVDAATKFAGLEGHKKELAQIPVLGFVMLDLKDRAEMGKRKYGTYLMTGNKRDALKDAYEEALDLVMYLKQIIIELS